MIPPPRHDWTVRVGGRWFGLVGDETVSGSVADQNVYSVTSVHYGFGHVRLPMHIYAFVGVVTVVPILLALIYVARRRAKRAA